MAIQIQKQSEVLLSLHSTLVGQTLPSDRHKTSDDVEGIRVLFSLDNLNLSPAVVAATATQILLLWPEHLDRFFLSVDSITYYNVHFEDYETKDASIEAALRT